MKFSTTLFTSVLAATALAASDSDESSKSGLAKYLVIFEKGMDTPKEIVASVEDRLKQLGAYITHEYNTILKGFAVSAPEEAMTKLKDDPTAQSQQYPFIIEEDQVVSANDPAN